MTGHTTPGQPTPGHTPAPPAARILLRASHTLGYVVPLVSALRGLHHPGATLLLPATPNRLENQCAKWWRTAGGVVVAAAGAASAAEWAASADAAVIAVVDLDPGPLEVLVACEELGVPAVGVYQGRYPYRPGTDQAAGLDRAQVAARVAARERAVEKRRPAA